MGLTVKGLGARFPYQWKKIEKGWNFPSKNPVPIPIEWIVALFSHFGHTPPLDPENYPGLQEIVLGHRRLCRHKLNRHVQW